MFFNMWNRNVRKISVRCYSQIAAAKEKYCNGMGKHAQSTKPEGWDAAKPFSSIPGPKPLPIIGNIWRFFVQPLAVQDVLQQNMKQNNMYGDIVSFTKLGSLPDMVALYSSADIEKMYRNEGPWPIREGFYSMKHYRNVIRNDIFGETGSLLTAHGEDWQKVRSIVNPILMQPQTVQQYIGSMSEVASDFIKRMKFLDQSSPIGEMPADFDNELNKWAFESIGVIALDRRLGCLDETINPEVQKMVTYMVETFKMMVTLDYTPIGLFCRMYNMPLWKRFVKYQDFFTNMTLKFIDEAAEKIKKDSNYESKSESEKSAFEKLLKKDKTIAMVMTLDMLSAGIDTTGKTLASILYFLAKNKDKQDKLREEIVKLLPSPTSPVTKEVLAEIPYLKAVIKEAQRIAPITTGNLRLTTKEMVLGGYQIPKGILILCSHLYITLYKNHYVKPNEFIPERWLKTTDGQLSHKNTHPFVCMPFGFGPRSCIGQRLANLELQVVVAKIVRSFYMDWPHADMRFGSDLLYGIKDPLKIHLKEITN